jgi:hypothetical protein
MKKAFKAILGFLVLFFSGCASTMYLMDGIVPFEYFQNFKNKDERLVYFAPVLTAPNQWCSYLYIITNPEDIYLAEDKFANHDILPIKQTQKLLKEFCPIRIESSSKYSNGIAIFSLPKYVDKFFYVYIGYRNDIKYTSDYSTEVFSGIMPLPTGSNDIYIGISEVSGQKKDIGIYASANPTEIKAIYNNTTGIYGIHEAKNKKQTGFIEVGFKERVAILRQNAKEDAPHLASLRITSGYFTYQQETRTRRVMVDIGGTRVEKGEEIQFYDQYGVKTGEARTEDKRHYEPPKYENRTETVNIPVRHELSFELYRGNVKIYSGTTPAEISPLESGEEYILRWVSPVHGNSEWRFIMPNPLFSSSVPATQYARIE